MRKIWLSLIALSLTMPSMAIIARKGVYTVTQSDGSIINVIKIGDERGHTYLTTDGIPVGRINSTEDFHYLTPDGLSDIKAHNANQRNDTELLFIRENMEDLSARRILQTRDRLSSLSKKANAVPKKKTAEVVNKGKAKIPVLLVQYKDKKFLDSNPLATFEQFFKEGSVNARQYFEDQSNGVFQPQFDVYGPYTLASNRATYGGNDYFGNDAGVGTMVAQACIGLAGQIDFSKYDNDGDGECDTVIVLYAGEGEASSDVDESVWPCQWNLESSDYGKFLSFNSTKINRFAVFNELNVMSGTPKVEGIGTFCHEFSHCLGLPDFYDTNYAGHFGMATWSLMDSGSYNNDGYTPIGYSAYEKEFMGWLTIDAAATNTHYTIPVFNSGNAATDKAIKITNPADADEYYIIENRACQGWDEYMPAEGLMITHVTYNKSAWDTNTVNDYDLQRMTLVPADGQLKLNSFQYYGDTYYEPDEESLRGDLWPYGQADALTDDTTPSFSPNKGKSIGMPVTEMTRNSDGTISFWIAKGQLPPLLPPTVSGSNTPLINGHDSFTATWQASDADDVTYTLNVFERQNKPYELAMSSKFIKNGDYTDSWDTSGSTEFYTQSGGTSEAIKLGSNSKTGAVITKSDITIGNYDCATVVLKAKSFGTDTNVKLKISALSGLLTLSSNEVTLSSTESEYRVLLPQLSNNFKIKIETVTAKKRAYLYSADIYLGDATSASARTREASNVTGNQTDMTISGITDTQYTLTGLKPDAIYCYRVKAVTTNEHGSSESPWSETVTVDLSGASISDCHADTETENITYFNLQGSRVTTGNMTPGIYIKRNGTETVKVYVK